MRLVPQPVMYVFVNGLAVVIFMSQLEQFKTVSNGTSVWLSGNALRTMCSLVLLTIGIIVVWPKVTKAVPPSLVAIDCKILLKNAASVIDVNVMEDPHYKVS